MSRDLISKKTRYEFREFLVGWTLREIEMEFDAADVPWSDVDLPISGQRRTLVEQYYHTINFSNWQDVKKVLSVYEGIINQVIDHSPDIANKLLRFLGRDGFEYKNGRLQPASGIPTSMGLKSLANELDADELNRQINRIESNVDTDPSLAIGTAKELVETCCKTILKEHGETIPKGADVGQLVKATLKTLKLLPDDIPESAKGSKTIKRTLSNLSSVTQGLAELRNLYGTGHGKHAKSKGIQPRHARLAAGAAISLATFLFETNKARD